MLQSRPNGLSSVRSLMLQNLTPVDPERYPRFLTIDDGPLQSLDCLHVILESFFPQLRHQPVFLNDGLLDGDALTRMTVGI